MIKEKPILNIIYCEYGPLGFFGYMSIVCFNDCSFRTELHTLKHAKRTDEWCIFRIERCSIFLSYHLFLKRFKKKLSFEKK